MVIAPSPSPQLLGSCCVRKLRGSVKDRSSVKFVNSAGSDPVHISFWGEAWSARPCGECEHQDDKLACSTCQLVAAKLQSVQARHLQRQGAWQGA